MDRARIDSMALTQWGKTVWRNRQCQGCHELGRDQSTGPNLVGVTDRRPVEWLRKWLKDPAGMARDDGAASELKKKFGSQMPNLNLSPHDIEGLIAYLAQETATRAAH